MATYEEQLNAIRAARAERDQAREQLHEQLIKQLTLLRAQRRADRKEVAPDPALQAVIAQLRDRIKADSEKLRQVEAELQRTQSPGQRQELEHQRDQLQQEIKRDQAEIARLAETARAHDDHSHDLDRGRSVIADQRGILSEKEKAVGALLDNLFRDLTPQTLIEQWNDAFPIMLLPLRLETRFKTVDNTEQLWVRVYPDDIFVTTHEKILTDRENEFGQGYWKLLAGATDEQQKKDAWRDLADKFGAHRAAWVALQTKPINWSTPPPSADQLQFPVVELTKPDNWTEAPHTLMLPDRFVLMAFRGGNLVHSQVGKQIKDRVILGPAPLEDEDKPSLTRDPADNRLKFSEDFLWLTDFPKAIDNGMGFIVPLDAIDIHSGFDQLLVLGVKLSANESDGQKLLEDLLDNHHYSAKGLSLVKQGSATNNTDDEDSHFSSSDPLHDVSYFVETGEPLFTLESDPNKSKDGQRLCEYLGIDYKPLQFVGNADATDHNEAVAMNRALYAGTLGYFLHSMLNEVMSEETIRDLREFFTDSVTGRGPIPAIRVGNQPYGILLTSNFQKWSYPQFAILRQPVFDEHVRKLLFHLEGLWRSFKTQLAHISKSGNAGANLMQVLGLQPTSADYYHRVGYSFDYLKNLEQFQAGGSNFGDVIMAMFEGLTGRSFLNSFGYKSQRDDGTTKPVPLLFQLIYQHYHTRLNNQNLIDGLPLSEERTIKPYDEGTGKNYIDWLLQNSADVDKLEKQDFGTGVTKPNALCNIM